MARPQPIIVPALSQNVEGPGRTQAAQSIGNLIGALIGRQVQQGQERSQQEAFREAFSGLFPTEQVEAAGPRLPTGGIEQVGIAGEGAALEPPPTAEVVPPNIGVLAQLLSQTPQGRELGQQFAVKQAFPTAPGKREITKDVAGFQRFVDSGERVFPGAEKPGKEPKSIFGTISDISKYTPESIAAAEVSNSRGDLIIRPEVLENSISGKDKFDAERSLMKDFTAESKVFKDTRDAFGRIRAVGSSKTAAGDLALIFNFMKMLDPGSVVRESEFRSAEQAKSWLIKSEESGIIIPSFVKTAIQKADPEQKGAFLLPDQRTDFINQSRNIMKEQTTTHKQREGTFGDVAERNKLDVKNVVLEFKDPLFEKSLVEEPAEVAIEALPEGSTSAGLITEGPNKGKEAFKTSDGRLFFKE